MAEIRSADPDGTDRCGSTSWLFHGTGRGETPTGDGWASPPSAPGVIRSNVKGQRRQGMIDEDQMQAISQVVRFCFSICDTQLGRPAGVGHAAPAGLFVRSDGSIVAAEPLEAP